MSTAIRFHPTLPMDHPFSRHSNSAGGPLPRIPRRTSSTYQVAQAIGTLHGLFPREQSASPPSPSTPVKLLSPPTTLVVQPPTPPLPMPIPQSGIPSEEHASTSSTLPSPAVKPAPRPRRVRSGHASVFLMRPPEESTPTPSVFRAKTSEDGVAFPRRPSPVDDYFNHETPRPSTSTLRPTTSTTITSTPEWSTIVRPEPAARSVSVSIPADASAQLLRKKSGEPLKSSLKSRRTLTRGDLSVVTSAGVATKSEPSTPTQIKSVHFDAQLEHVKLFLAEQKPLAVSRDGSPTDTSGTESDFPSFIFGADHRAGTSLTMEVVNMPATIDKAADVALEALVLSSDRTSINGRVRVRNVAFEKWIAVRFTLDWWQTTSEVTAKYMQTLDDGKFDIFAFTIRLTDVLSRIEEKTLFLAIRYTVTGREVWDNNAGENYQVKFSRSKAEAQTNGGQTSEPGIVDLKKRLEKVAIGQETVGGYLAHQSQKSPSPQKEQFDLRSNTPLSSRYDFSASLKNPWKMGSPKSPSHSRNSTYPTAFPQFPEHLFQSRPFRANVAEDPASLTRGSPRILDDDVTHQSTSFYAASDSEDHLPSTPSVISRQRGRTHQRDYFDLGFTPKSGIRKMLPAAFREDATPRYNSVDTHRVSPSAGAVPKTADQVAGLFHPWPLARGGSEESTPSITSTSESSCSSSPSGSPVDDPVIFNFLGRNGDRARSPVNEINHLNMFLNKFCFYTGSDSLLDVQPDVIQRSHSASSVEEFLSSPKSNYHVSPAVTPTRSSSYDDVACMSGAASGSSTPTARSIFEAESSTPISLAY